MLYICRANVSLIIRQKAFFMETLLSHGKCFYTHLKNIALKKRSDDSVSLEEKTPSAQTEVKMLHVFGSYFVQCSISLHTEDSRGLLMEVSAHSMR